MPNRPKNFLEVLLGSVGSTMSNVGANYANVKKEQAQQPIEMLQQALDIDSHMRARELHEQKMAMLNEQLIGVTRDNMRLSWQDGKTPEEIEEYERTLEANKIAEQEALAAKLYHTYGDVGEVTTKVGDNTVKFKPPEEADPKGRSFPEDNLSEGQKYKAKHERAKYGIAESPLIEKRVFEAVDNPKKLEQTRTRFKSLANQYARTGSNSEITWGGAKVQPVNYAQAAQESGYSPRYDGTREDVQAGFLEKYGKGELSMPDLMAKLNEVNDHFDHLYDYTLNRYETMFGEDEDGEQ